MNDFFGTWMTRWMLGGLVLLGLSGCRLEPTHWNADIALPLVDATWGWSEFLGDTLGR